MKSGLAVPGAVVAFLIALYAIMAAEMTPGVTAVGTDWAMYVMHARNIVKGLPYTQTGYVFQPESTTEVGANSYPSGYPLLLAPFYAAFGPDLKLFKLLTAAMLVLSLWPIYLFARRTLPPVYGLLLVITLGLSGEYLGSFDGPGSDAPYQLASYLVLLLLLKIYDRHLGETNPWKWGTVAGLSMAGAYLIRPVGLALVLATGGLELLRSRRITRFLIAVGLAFLPLLLLNNFLLHRDSTYAYQFTLSVPRIAKHAIAYAGFFSYVFVNPWSHPLRYCLWGVTVILALTAIVQRIRSGVQITELYLLVILAVDSVYWEADARYVICVMPIYLVYVFEGFRVLLARIPVAFSRPVQAGAAVLLLVAPAANAALLRPDPHDTLVTAPRYEQLCDAVRRLTAPAALVLFWNPRVLAFSTGRSASGWPAIGPPERLTRYVSQVHAGYVVADKSRADDRRLLLPLMTNADSHVTRLFENDGFVLMQIQAGAANSPQ